MTLRSRVRRDGDQEEDAGRRAPHLREAPSQAPGLATAADAQLVGRLPDAQLQRMAESIQGSLGNRGTAAVLAGVQRDATRPDGASLAADQRRVQILTARLLEKPKFLAPTIAVLSRGDLVRLTGERKADWHWVVTTDGDLGWLHQSAWLTTTPKLSSAPGAGGSGPPDEIEIGGRG